MESDRLTVEDAGAASAPVSFPCEELILVDSRDCETGFATKARIHAGDGLRHRAFSVFLFDAQQRLLVHRRSERKPLWPGYWTNSCCSHPRRDETLDEAVRRRLGEELGVAAELEQVFHFEYHAPYRDVGSEHELCHVFLAHLRPGQALSFHTQEIDAVRWMSVHEVDCWMAGAKARDELTPWFRLEWESLRGRYAADLQRFLMRRKKPAILNARDASPCVA